MNVDEFYRVCDQFLPVTASGFYVVAERWLGYPTATLQRRDVVELTWLDDSEVIAWVVRRCDPVAEVWYPTLGGQQL